MATWVGPGNNYLTAANWNPANVPDTAAETAEFTNNGAPTTVTIDGNVDVGGFTFAASSFTIHVSQSTLRFFGAGIVNNSGLAQNLSIGVTSFVDFHGSSSAGNATITTNASVLRFFDTSSGGTARIINNGFLFVATSSGALSIGSLEGNGTVFASAMNGGVNSQVLTVGSLDTSTTFSGVLGQGTQLGLTKVGTGTLTLSGTVSYTGATTISAGTLALIGTTSLATSSGVEANSTFDISGTNAGTAIKTLSGSGTVDLGSRNLTITNASTTFSGAINGNGGLVLDAGTQTLSGNSNYTGDTVVNGGTLVVEGSLHSNSAIVNNHGTLSSNGVNGLLGGGAIINAGGTLAPGGAGAGVITVTDDASFSGSSATFEVQIGGTAPGAQYDQLVMGFGRAHLGGATLRASLINGFNPQTGATFGIVLQALGGISVDGTFAGLPNGATFTISGSKFSINYGAVPGSFGINGAYLTALDDAGIARNDAFAVAENRVLSGRNVFTNNGFGADSDIDNTLAVTAVNGVAASVGQQITLPSGALLTLNANGTFRYDPNGAFDHLPAPGSGASKTSATDSFTYTLTGSDIATVRITVQGIDSDDILRGTAGNDTLVGGIGNDTYVVENVRDVIHELAGQGALDRVLARVSYVLTAGVAVEIMSTTNASGTGAINLTGNEIANTIHGNAGINRLTGAGGNDVLNGHAGNDTLNGGDGDDRLAGGAGQNIMAGGAGNDTYIVSSATDTIIETAGQGAIDRAYASVSYALAAAAQVEFLATSDIAGTAAINLTGNAFANTIYGNNGANVLSGKGGNDLLAGRGGADVFAFDTAPNTQTNRDIIADFNGAQDLIRLAKSVFTAITGDAGTVLSVDQFVIGPQAQDDNDRIIYSNGWLIYDHNGDTPGGGQLIAVLAGRPSLSNTDIVLG